ncbi:tripartite tricarboxylate transporter substrate binding protein [Halalkalibacter oceani]|uniref:tripartite tricarboxylate transporter substrate binding protein n=1 Tax=Halalkalibacter oceani TaxID=1653776 RepID=UPI003397D2D1
MKKIFFGLLVLPLAFSLVVACSGEQGQEANSSNQSDNENEITYPNEDITFIVGAPAGGGTDIGIRTLMPYVEEELGINVTVVNMEGASNWVALNELANSEPDGYTLSNFNAPGATSGYMNPEFDRNHDLDSFTTVANHVTDSNIIAVNPNEDRFTTIEELMEYAQENTVTATTAGIGSDDHIASAKLNHEFGTQFEPIHSPDGTPEMIANVMGGHVDVLFANVGEIVQLHESGELKVLAVMAEERDEFLPDVPTLIEAGYPITNSSYRGILAPAGLDPAILEILETAFEQAITNEEHIEEMAQTGLRVDYQNSEQYRESLEETEQTVRELSDVMGW